mgnify:CR=1 FL=1
MLRIFWFFRVFFHFFFENFVKGLAEFGCEVMFDPAGEFPAPAFDQELSKTTIIVGLSIVLFVDIETEGEGRSHMFER